MRTLESISRFSEALGHAIFDRELEDAGEELLFFYDADVAIDTIVGLTSWARSTPPEIDGLHYVIRALFSTGFLPTGRFLRPHLLEFGRIIESLPDTPMQEGFHRAAMNHLIREWKLTESEAALRKMLEVDEGNGFYSFLREHGYDVFVKLELCLGGTWKQRLNRMLRAGCFHFAADGGTDARMFHDPIANSISRTLLRWRPEMSHSNSRDAYAVTELMRKIDSGIHARFYTATAALWRFFRTTDNSLRGALLEDGLPIERSDEYFLIRSSFAALAFTSHSTVSPRNLRDVASDTFTLPELKKLHQELSTLLQSTSIQLEVTGHNGRQSLLPEQVDLHSQVYTALEQMPVGEIHLGELIDHFYNLGFLGSVFLSWTPEEMRYWLPGLYDIKSQTPVVDETRRQLGMSLDGLRGVLEREIGQLRTWREDFATILSAAEIRAQAFNGHRPRLDTDLGWGRWGIEEVLDPTMLARLETRISGLIESSTRESNASELAVLVSHKGASLDEFIEAILLLWFLQTNDLLHRRFECGAQPRSWEIPPWLEMIHLIAETKSAGLRFRRGMSLQSHLNVLSTRARQIVDGTTHPGWHRGFAEMGLAHVMYWAWITNGFDMHGPARQWAEESFSAAQRAQRLLERGSLAWAFATNHCAYLGMRAGIHPEATETALLTLSSQTPRAWWHYRFADTVACATCEAIQREINRHGLQQILSNPELAHLRREFCRQLRFAGARLSEYDNWGDEAAVRTVFVIDHWLLRLGCD
jgi:hypothetical protein